MQIVPTILRGLDFWFFLVKIIFKSLQIYRFFLLVHVVFFFFCGGRGLNSRPCIYYTLSLPTELSSREPMLFCFNMSYRSL